MFYGPKVLMLADRAGGRRFLLLETSLVAFKSHWRIIVFDVRDDFNHFINLLGIGLL